MQHPYTRTPIVLLYCSIGLCYCALWLFCTVVVLQCAVEWPGVQLANIDRCRKLYEKYLELMPENCQAWTRYAGLEDNLEEFERARKIYELAVSQPVLDAPEVYRAMVARLLLVSASTNTIGVRVYGCCMRFH